MKTTFWRRWLALLLALTLTLALSPAVLAAEEDGSGSDTEESTPGEDGDGGEDEQPPTPSDPPAITLISHNKPFTGTDLGNVDPGSSIPMKAGFSNGDVGNTRFTWVSADEKIARVEYHTDTPERTQEANISGVAPGETTITISCDKEGVKEVTLKVTVSGIAVLKPEISILENEAYTLKEGTDFKRFGTAAGDTAVPVLTSKNQTFVRATGSSWTNLVLDGLETGTAQVTLAAAVSGTTIGGVGTFTVTVGSNQAATIQANASTSSPLRFSTLESQIASQCASLISGSSLVSITALTVNTAQGTLYLGYKSPDDTGSGVGSALTYYAANQNRGPYIKDIAFVPSSTYPGDTATITYTGTSSNNRTFKGKIEVTLAKASTDVTLTASPENPAKLSGSLFGEVCQRETGAPLSYIVFTLPPATQGTLYEGYVSDSDYTARVNATEQYSQTAINNLTFVPAQGYVGLVSIGYSGYSATGVKYSGELKINVTQSLDQSIVYKDSGSGSVHFSGYDFSNYCSNVTGGILSYVSFTLPAASQGVLYRGWNGGRGSSVLTGEQLNASQLDNVTFVTANGFSGTVRIPFTGLSRTGIQFTGMVEIHCQSSGSSDITYNCTPGGSVKLSTEDFNNLSMQLTGQRLHYITFDLLPNYTDGSLFHNRTSANAMGDRVSRDAKYFNSATPYIMNLSFWATDSFRGSIDIPFTGCAVSGETFSGLMVISSSNAAGGLNYIPYTTMGRQPVTFNSDDFDAVSRSATNSSLNYVRFMLPSSSQGILYFDYHAANASVPISSTDNLYRSGEASVSKVSFLPAYGYSGTVLIPFSGYAISGAQFQGTVEITVRGGATDTTVRYNTHGSPVVFSLYEFQAAGGNQPVTIHLDSLPAPSAGKLYYQYTCPTKYSWAATPTDYHLNSDPQISKLTFIPRAGFTGTVSIPYTATNADGTKFTGQISINVEEAYSSAYFNDLGSCNTETLAAIDFLSSQNIVNGVSAGKFAPNLPIRRGDFCLMLYRAFQFPSDGAVSLFSDVPDGAYYAQAIRVLRSVGIVNGTGSNHFQPNANISRQDAAVMIQRTLRAAKISAPDGSASLLSAYSDGGSVAGYAQGALACLIEQEMLPTSWTKLWPSYALTRADMAVLLHRAMTR